MSNLRDFIRYLNLTLNILDKNVADEDFEKPDSDVYKFFIMLFKIYINKQTEKKKVRKKRRPPEPPIRRPPEPPIRRQIETTTSGDSDEIDNKINALKKILSNIPS